MYDVKTLVRKAFALTALFAVLAVPSELFYRNKGLFTHGSWELIRDVHLRLLLRPVHASEPPAGEALSVPVLTYRGNPYSEGGTGVSGRDFLDQMYALKAEGWRTATVAELGSFVAGRKALPAKTFVLTFDDSRAVDIYAADPVLRELGYTAALFIATDLALDDTANKGYLNVRELRQLIRSGRWEVHSAGDAVRTTVPVDDAGTKGNFMTDRMWLAGEERLETVEEYGERIREDMRLSKRKLEDALGVDVGALAFRANPFGRQVGNLPNADVIVRSAVDEQYALSFTQADLERGDAVAQFGSRERLVPRIRVGAGWLPERLVRALKTTADQPLPFTDDAKSERGLLRGWGELRRDDGGYTLASGPVHTSAFAFVDGGDQWRDYDFGADVTAVAGTSAVVAARVRRVGADFEYVTCALDGEKAIMRVRWKGQEYKVAEKEFKHDVTKPSWLDIDARGQQFSCGVNGETVLASVTLQIAPATGTIGILAWHPDHGDAQMTARELHVAEVRPQ